MTQQHTPEPWAIHEDASGDIFISGSDHTYITEIGNPDEDGAAADARRIVACVNACEGMTTDELDTLPRGFKRLQAAYLDLYNERTTPAEKARDELLAALERAKSDIGKLPTPIVTDSAGRNHLAGSPMPLMRVIERIDAAIAKAKGGAA
ncbi:hypothetical protein P5G63_19470 [Aeromonas salmonicida]|uniref:hypothetical protein n=1 Tax=Aeromonas salmonicida TaxID=645 RepID=UPI00223FDD77|nr:hypothetical protein [Aeromonas salmonicida]MDF8330544.1 hypothetical protein [Aeromonas salmonicida]